MLLLLPVPGLSIGAVMQVAFGRSCDVPGLTEDFGPKGFWWKIPSWMTTKAIKPIAW